jgi:hypothetical protein
MLMCVVIMTRRDFTEGLAYLSEDFHESAGMGRVVLNNNPGLYLRAWVRKVPMNHRQAADFWATQGLGDGRVNIPCPLVPKRFAAVYRKHFDAGRKEAAQG